MTPEGGISTWKAFNSLSYQGNLLESFKHGTIWSGLWFFRNAPGCSLNNATTNLYSISVDLPYLGNKSEKGRKLEAIVIIKAGKASA